MYVCTHEMWCNFYNCKENSKWLYLSLWIDIMIQYDGIISLVTTHTQVE